jgi:3-oxoacyl-[acyl-carrier protein] reductase
MATSLQTRHALVLGGTGAIGSAVLKALAHKGVPTSFTYFRSEEKARALASELSMHASCIDLTKAAAIRALFRDLKRVDILIHCAAIHRAATVLELTEEDFDTSVAISGRATFIAVQEMTRRLEGEGDVVLVSALERTQSLPLAPSFAAAQGMLGPLAMSLAKELGPRNIRVNVVASGLIGAGISTGINPKLVKDYEKLSALRRLGTAEEVANAIVFLATANHYMNGKTLAVNGGI